MQHDPVPPHDATEMERDVATDHMNVAVRTDREIGEAKNEMLLRLLRLHYLGVLEALNRGHVRVVDTALFPVTDSKSRRILPRWIFNQWQQFSREITTYLGDKPIEQLPSDFDAGMVFGKLEALLWLGGHPFEHLKNEFRRLQFLGITEPLTIGPRTATDHLDVGRKFVRRSDKEIGAAMNEVTARVWYNRCYLGILHDLDHGTIKAVAPRAPGDCQSVIHEDILDRAHTHARRIERELGGEHLCPANEFDWGIVNGRLSALRWSLGDDWDNLDT